MGLLDVIGPVMVGPSSSHTAGACRLALLARHALKSPPTRAAVALHGSFAKTAKGHGTDRALAAGLLGYPPDDARIPNALEIAAAEGLELKFSAKDLGDVHPNTVQFSLAAPGEQLALTGSSLGGGMVRVFRVDGFDLNFTGGYHTLLLRHSDRAGVIATVARVLADDAVNIATLHCARGNGARGRRGDDVPGTGNSSLGACAGVPFAARRRRLAPAPARRDASGYKPRRAVRQSWAGGLPTVTLNDLMAVSGRASEAILGDSAPPDEQAALLKVMRGRLGEMRASIKRGLESDAPSRTGMVGWNAKTLWEGPDPLRAPLLKRVQAYAMAVNEENARMGRIVAAPTAGSAGTVPGALIGVCDELGFSDDDLLMPLVLAAGIGEIISQTMFVAGASGGCGAEIGPSAAMAAAAVCELLGGSAKQAVHAAAMALMNTIGLVCDPVGGFVEVPCVSRNAFYSVHAVSAAQLARAGLESFIPPDEVVSAMASVGRMLPPELRETGEGGIADTPTGRRIALKMAD